MTKNILEIFGKNVREYRQANGLSQERLAEEAGFHRTYISMVERGERNISLKNIVHLAQALKVSISDLTKNL